MTASVPMNKSEIILGRRYLIVRLSGEKDNLMIIGICDNGNYVCLRENSVLYNNTGSMITENMLSGYQINPQYLKQRYWVVTPDQILQPSLVRTRCNICNAQ